jgi:hypothetical protein
MPVVLLIRLTPTTASMALFSPIIAGSSTTGCGSYIATVFILAFFFVIAMVVVADNIVSMNAGTAPGVAREPRKAKTKWVIVARWR